MEENTAARKTTYSVQLKFLTVFLCFVIILLALLNTYPTTTSRDLVFSSKHRSLQSQATVMSSSLSALETLTEDGVSQAMALLDVMPLNRVIVTDRDGRIVYDTSQTNSKLGCYALFAEIGRALQGKAVFYSSYSDDAFMSRAAVPIVNRGIVIGAVYLYEYDVEQAALIADIRASMRTVSLVVGVFSLTTLLIFTSALTRRIRELVKALRIVREGNYNYRVRLRGRDELSELGAEFNNMTHRIQMTEEMRRRFVSDASHELKTPLASIRLLSDSIVHSGNMDSDTMREFVTDIGAEAERLQRTTEKLLDLTRMDQASPANFKDLHPISVKNVAENTLRLLGPLAAERGVSLNYELDPDCLILALEDDIYGVIFNLIENAIKYNVTGGSVTLTLRSEGKNVLLTVEDTGIGIPESDMPHIFTRFYRVDKARSREAGGSGLGLSIVHDIVAFYGGTVQVSAREGGGTRFDVRFKRHTGKDVDHA